jgi:hypothetical protein
LGSSIATTTYPGVSAMIIGLTIGHMSGCENAGM